MATGNPSRQLNPVQFCPTPSAVFIPGSFELNGDDASPINARGEGFVVTHSGGDDYLITFATKYPECVSFVPSLEDAAAGTAVLDATVTSERYDATTGSVIVRVSKESTDTLTKNDTLDGPRVNFVAVMFRYTGLATTHA